MSDLKNTIPKEKNKATPLKEILAALIEKNKKPEAVQKKEKDPKSGVEKKIVNHGLERGVSILERLDTTKRKAIENMNLSREIAKTVREKPEKQVVIVDLRTEAGEKAKALTQSVKNAVKEKVKETGGPAQKKNTDVKEQFEVKLFSKSASIQEGIAVAKNTLAEEPVDVKTNFSSRLADVMKNEIVKHTGIILKNGSEGEIHLLLKPESLGSVRIKLNIEDNNIVGKIIVDNNTVKEIMKDNLANLENALHDNGYQNTSFNVFVAGERQDGNDGAEAFASLLGDSGKTRPGTALKGIEYSDESIYDESLVNILM
jgi:flagellar hook-length control protein FliK